jgi:hypothetical protein
MDDVGAPGRRDDPVERQGDRGAVEASDRAERDRIAAGRVTGSDEADVYLERSQPHLEPTSNVKRTSKLPRERRYAEEDSHSQSARFEARTELTE